MTRQLDQWREDSQHKKDVEVLRLLEYGLLEDVARSGAVLQGFSVRLNGVEALVTLRGDMAGRPQVCFVGAGDLPQALRKVGRLARSDKLKWREDKYGKASS